MRYVGFCRGVPLVMIGFRFRFARVALMCVRAYACACVEGLGAQQLMAVSVADFAKCLHHCQSSFDGGFHFDVRVGLVHLAQGLLRCGARKSKHHKGCKSLLENLGVGSRLNY